ncbi:MAG TPA: Holliday junction resolvase RuvX [Candidatus Brocadiia bacterium]|nr:Holliday junction resolvase RuvX [Planctomycetota bacterium]MBI4006870.1 Holliday junction resolvase RuvX [Planctomycetota bacterium]MDO8094200.1 Holliday junction resolvase RuvX [Candidatus Brocadiales bacterium]
MRILCIDYGEKRLGLAVSDPLGLTAQGLPTLIRQDEKSDMLKLSEIINEKVVNEIVIGLPKNMNGTLGKKAEEVLKFVEFLKSRFSLPVHTVDERLSTVRAHRSMLEGDLSRKKRGKRVDMIAAQLILQSYLDRKNK